MRRAIYWGLFAPAAVGWAACSNLPSRGAPGLITTIAAEESTVTTGGPPPPALPAGPAVSADPPPPPIQGGTLLVARDGVTAVAADPDRDAVYLVDLAAVAL